MSWLVYIVECELPYYLGENVILTNEDNDPLLKDSSILLSCSPGYSLPSSGKEAVVTMCTCESDGLCVWQPDPTNLQCLSMLSINSHCYCFWNVTWYIAYTGDCGSLPLNNKVYTILFQTNNTTKGSVIEFQCLHTNEATQLMAKYNNTFAAECLNNGQWYPDPRNVCRTLNVGYGQFSTCFMQSFDSAWQCIMS